MAIENIDDFGFVLPKFISYKLFITIAHAAGFIEGSNGKFAP